MALENNEVYHEITESIAVLAENKSGWTKEFNLVSWNGNQARYDIRDWDPEHDKCGRGVTLSEDEIKSLKTALNERF